MTGTHNVIDELMTRDSAWSTLAEGLASRRCRS